MNSFKVYELTLFAGITFFAGLSLYYARKVECMVQSDDSPLLEKEMIQKILSDSSFKENYFKKYPNSVLLKFLGNLENIDIEDIKEFEYFCAIHSRIESLPRCLYAFVMKHMKMLSSEFGSEEHTKARKSLMKACAECTFYDDIRFLTEMDSNKDPYRYYINMAKYFGIEFVYFLLTTQEYLDRITTEIGILPILCEAIKYDKMDLELFKHVLDCQLRACPPNTDPIIYLDLDNLTNISIEKDNCEYLKYISEKILLFYDVNRIRTFFELCNIYIKEYNSSKCLSYIEDLHEEWNKKLLL
jgi:hypothetical protein